MGHYGYSSQPKRLLEATIDVPQMASFHLPDSGYVLNTPPFNSSSLIIWQIVVKSPPGAVLVENLGSSDKNFVTKNQKYGHLPVDDDV